MNKVVLTPTDSINEAIAHFPEDVPLEIALLAGTYVEKVKIARSNVLLRGQLDAEVTIQYDDYNNKMHEDSLCYNTFRTPTLTVTGDNVTLENLTIQNTAPFSLKTGQAVALALYGNNTLVENCTIKAFQDTLFIGPLPLDLIERYRHILADDELTAKIGFHRFDNCRIEGIIDFIFGSGDALFNNCEIKLIERGYVTAPAQHHPDQLGFIFNRCKIINASNEPMILARPWRDHGKVTFYECEIKGLITERYDTWDKEHFYFYEEPYVNHPLAKPLTDKKIKELLTSINSSK